MSDPNEVQPSLSEASFWTRFAYYVFFKTPPVHYRDWVERDVRSRAWTFRLVVTDIVLGALIAAVFVLSMDEWHWYFLMLPVSRPTLDLLFSKRRRGQMLRGYSQRWAKEIEAQRNLSRIPS